MPITLPTSPTPATTVSPKILTIYGPPKVGKTSICTVLPNSLLIDIENGSNYLDAVKLKPDNILQLNEIEAEIRKQKYPYKFVILDTLDMLETWCEAEATRLYKASIQGKTFTGESVLELPQGGGYFHLRNAFYAYFHKVRLMAPHVIFVGHVRDKMLTAVGKEVSSRDLDLTGKIKNIVCSYSDAIGHIFRDNKGDLKISFITNETLACGSRCSHLKGKEIGFNQPATIENWKQIYPDLL
jgi:hypothetical protein